VIRGEISGGLELRQYEHNGADQLVLDIEFSLLRAAPLVLDAIQCAWRKTINSHRSMFPPVVNVEG
jgi:hypothetical protein